MDQLNPLPNRRFIRPVVFSYSAASATAAVVQCYGFNTGTGAQEAIDLTALSAGQGLAITDIALVQTDAGTTSIFHTVDSAAGRIIRGSYADNGGHDRSYKQNRYLAPLAALKVTHDAQIDLNGAGFIYEGGD